MIKGKLVLTLKAPYPSSKSKKNINGVRSAVKEFDGITGIDKKDKSGDVVATFELDHELRLEPLAKAILALRDVRNVHVQRA